VRELDQQGLECHPLENYLREMKKKEEEDKDTDKKEDSN
jgi:hypothetical protein